MGGENTIGVEVHMFGGLQRGGKSFVFDFPMGTSRREAVERLKKKLLEQGLAVPYQIYLNNRYALRMPDGETPIKENDVFKILPIMGGG